MNIVVFSNYHWLFLLKLCSFMFMNIKLKLSILTKNIYNNPSFNKKINFNTYGKLFWLQCALSTGNKSLKLQIGRWAKDFEIDQRPHRFFFQFNLIGICTTIYYYFGIPVVLVPDFLTQMRAFTSYCFL